MRKKIEKLLKRNPAILSGLLVVILGSVWLWKIGEKRILKDEGKLFFGQFESFCFNQLCISQEDGVWMVNDSKTKTPANNEATETMMGRLKEIKLIEKVSENADKFESMGIGGKDKVIISAGDRKLEIGDISSDYSGTYIRENEGRVVYKVGVVLDKKAILTLDYWGKKTVSNLPRFQIKKVTIIKGEKKIELSPKEGKWENEKLIDRVAFLNSIKYLDDFKADFKNKLEIEIETDKEKNRLILGKNQLDRKNFVYWVSNEGKYFFEISKEDFDLLTGIIN